MKKRSKPTYEQVVTNFVEGCGLRRSELERLRVRDFYQMKRDFIYEQEWIHVDGPAHEVPFLEPFVWTIAEVCKKKHPDDLVFPVLPDLDYEELRWCYTYLLFFSRYETIGAMQGPRALHDVGQQVKHALGLPRLDAELQRWMRWARRDFMREFG